DRVLGEHADVQGIVVAGSDGRARPPRGQGGDVRRAPRLRHEAVWGGTDVRELLRSVELQMTTRLVDLVLDGIRGNDLDERVDDRRRVGTQRDAVPWMGLQASGHAGRLV